MNVKELTHSQQQLQAPKTHKKESTVRLTTRITMLWAPQRSLLYGLKDSIEVKCKSLSKHKGLVVHHKSRQPCVSSCREEDPTLKG